MSRSNQEAAEGAHCDAVHRTDCDKQGKTAELEAAIKRLNEENARLKAALALADHQKHDVMKHDEEFYSDGAVFSNGKLSAEDVERYSRQLILQDGFGVEGQRKLLSSSVLVVGAGGIGSTALMYLAASGIGKMTIADHDRVDRTNLHRQVIHEDGNIGMNKAVSANLFVKALNPSVRCVAFENALMPDNAMELISTHDVVVDATDNPATRYLINDACVLSGRPLVSGSALGTEGQLTVYNHANGPCYRCLYPKPNTAHGSGKSCSDHGVLGPVPGLIGILQAVETLKVLTGVGSVMHDRLIMYDSLRCSFMNIQKPGKRSDCSVCGESPTIKSIEDSHEFYRSARGPSGLQNSCRIQEASSSSSDLPVEHSISCEEYHAIRESGASHILLDVRVTRQFEMCALEGAENIPLASLPTQLDRIEDRSNGSTPIFCICRRGIASVSATKLLIEAMKDRVGIHSVKNVSGGLNAWRRDVDSSFPMY